MSRLSQHNSVVASPLALALLGLLLFTSDVQAYIDPGIGSLGYQAALAAILGVALVARQFIARVVCAARSLFGKRDERRS